MKEVYLIYGISDCPACLRAQAFLMDRDLEYVFIQSDFSSAYRKLIKEEFEWQTFPIIVKLSGHQEVLVGGYDELKRLLNEPPQ
jgi:glutaredoxin